MTPNTKLYVQLQPIAAAVDQITVLQKRLISSDSSRLVAESALHMTVIHFGVISRVTDDITVHTGMATQVIIAKLDALIAEWQATIRQLDFKTTTLVPTSYEYFGAQRSTYALTFATSPELQRLHAECLRALKQFLISCGIENPDAFMAQNDNLRFAVALRPHLTIARAYSSQSVVPLPSPMVFRLMPLIY